MTKLSKLLSFALSLVLAAGNIYTGFNYGAFWGLDTNVKRLNDFRTGFGFAKNLTAAIPFDSARLFTCKTQGTIDEPTEAFDAAVETRTNLLLGFWISGGPLDIMIKNEMSALEKGFEKHGQALAEFVIGLSVGSEDIYRVQGGSEGPGVSAADVVASIKKVKQDIASSPFAKYMKGKPIGHVDIAEHAVVEGADFYGVTAYPYWHQDNITEGKESFHGTLENVKQRAGNTPIWIGEMGWPFEGPQRGEAVAGAQNLQTFWTEVGCSVVGIYTTFWFELIKDTQPDQPDWALIDTVTHKPRIDLSCPIGPQPSPPVAPPTASHPASSSQDSPTIVSLKHSSRKRTTHITTTVMITVKPSVLKSTTHVTTTIMVTVQPTASALSASASEGKEEDVTITVTSMKYVKPSRAAQAKETPPDPKHKSLAADITPVPEPTLIPIDIPWCVTVADIAWNGQYLPVDGHPAGPDGKCTPPPTYSGLPYGGPQTSAPLPPTTSKVRQTATPPSGIPSSSKAVASSSARSAFTSKSSLAADVTSSPAIVPSSTTRLHAPNPVLPSASSSAPAVSSRPIAPPTTSPPTASPPAAIPPADDLNEGFSSSVSPYQQPSTDATSLHQISSSPATEPPVSSITVKVTELENWGDDWATNHEPHEDDEDADQEWTGEDNDEIIDRQADILQKLIRCCGQPRPQAPPPLVVHPTVHSFVTVHDYITQVHSWLRGLQTGILEATEESFGKAPSAPLYASLLALDRLHFTEDAHGRADIQWRRLADHARKRREGTMIQ